MRHKYNTYVLYNWEIIQFIESDGRILSLKHTSLVDTLQVFSSVSYKYHRVLQISPSAPNNKK